MFYPTLASPLSALPGNSLLWFRLFNLGVALCAGALYFLIFKRLSRSWLWSTLLVWPFLYAMNHPEVINSGFKNSITCAYIPLFCAWLLVSGRPGRSWTWLCAGGLSAFAVLLREPFAVFALLGFIAI